MATAELQAAWTWYRAAIDDFEEIAGPALEDGRPLDEERIDAADGALAAAASASEAIRRACEPLLRECSDREGDEIAVLLLAAATLDSMLASDGLQLDPDAQGRDENFTEGAGLAEREAEPRADIIAAATYLYEGFLGISGAADPADGPQLRGVCLGAVDGLVNAATKPALRFTFHGLTAAPVSFAADTITEITGLSAAACRIRQPALRLLVEALEKVVAIVSHRAIDEAIDDIFRPITGALSNAGAAILGHVAGRPDAESRITESINTPADWTREQLASVNTKVNQLTSAYVDQMKWTARIAGWIARATPLVSVLAGPAGLAAVSGVNAIGLGFVAYTLTVRLGSRPVPSRTYGILAIVDERGLVPPN